MKGDIMAFRVAPWWWPVLAVASPALVPWMMSKNHRFKENREEALRANEKRIQAAEPLALPALDHLSLTVVCEYEHEEGFTGEPGVCYLLRTDQGSLLYDIGFGEQYTTFATNTSRLGLKMEDVDALAISHLHADHMGGLKAQRSRQVALPAEFGEAAGKPCYLPDSAQAEGFDAQITIEPQLLKGGLASTGPLARSLYFFGLTQEQALVAHVKGKGLFILTGCGHPTIEVVIRMVRKLSDEPIYAIGGGLHFPVTTGRGNYGGFQLQMIVGTGKPWWERVTDEDLTNTIRAIQKERPKRLLLSAHDTCDHALGRISREVDAEVQVLKAGATYAL
jgi:7,8-dihydropterin-6-yl-methyl-4-(beta-D-ribofuranosyl)aminobenzene 5'-phosphate synthase